MALPGCLPHCKLTGGTPEAPWPGIPSGAIRGRQPQPPTTLTAWLGKVKKPLRKRIEAKFLWAKAPSTSAKAQLQCQAEEGDPEIVNNV